MLKKEKKIKDENHIGGPPLFLMLGFLPQVRRGHGGFLMVKYRTDGLIPALGNVVSMACPDNLAPLEASLEFSLPIIDNNT